MSFKFELAANLPEMLLSKCITNKKVANRLHDEHADRGCLGAAPGGRQRWFDR